MIESIPFLILPLVASFVWIRCTTAGFICVCSQKRVRLWSAATWCRFGTLAPPSRRCQAFSGNQVLRPGAALGVWRRLGSLPKTTKAGTSPRTPYLLTQLKNAVKAPTDLPSVGTCHPLAGIFRGIIHVHPPGDTTFKCAYEAPLSLRALSAWEGRPRCFGGVHGGGGT
jgi:hypothetical protein